MKRRKTDIDKHLADTPGWTKGKDTIRKTFTFADFPEALLFVNHVGYLAQQADHHPDIDIRFKRVTLTLSTHSDGGVTTKDFSLAKQINN